MADDEKKHDEVSPYSLTISVIQNKLTMHLHDKVTKNMYEGAFSSDELLKCGFSQKQASNLGGISKFIATAKAGHNNLKCSISIEENDKMDAVNNNDEDAEGVHGVVVSGTAAKAAKIENEEVGVIKITKEDDFFGEIQFVMKLKKMPRKQGDINQDHMKDLKSQNVALKQHLNLLQEELNKLTQKSAMNDADIKGLKEETVSSKKEEKKLAKQVDVNNNDTKQRLDALQNDYREKDIRNKTERDELKEQLKINKAERDELKQNNLTLQQTLKEELNKITNDLKRMDNNIHCSMPRGSVIMWSGNTDNIPKGWKICDGKEGTPDLRDKFIIGAGAQYQVKKNGGNTNHSHHITVNPHQLTMDEMPTHNHGFYSNVWVNDDANNNIWICHKNGTGFKGLNCTQSGDANLRTHPKGGNSAHNHSAISSSTQHLPPFMALLFIQKMI